MFLAALAFDFFYVPPILKFTTNNTQYIFTFFLVLITAVYVGLMSGKLRREADLACVRDFRSSAVAELAKELTKSITVEQVAEVVQRHLSPLLQADISLGFPDHDDRLSFKSKKLPDIEVAQWSYDHSPGSGAWNDDTLSREGTDDSAPHEAALLGCDGAQSDRCPDVGEPRYKAAA